MTAISGKTGVIFIVGDPIAQVKSPAGVTAALRKRGADLIVVPAHVVPADLTAWCVGVTAMRNVVGILVTVPHKFAALALCSSTTKRAVSIGAVNAMRRDPAGRWLGDMCDGVGFVTGLRKAGCDPRGRRALLVGAGGAGSAIAHALVDAGVAALAIHEADGERRAALIGRLTAYGSVVPSVGSADPTGFDLVVNATPMGMRANDPLPVDVERLDADTFVGDVVTLPAVAAVPALIDAARRRGCATMTGIGMFEAVRDCLVDFYLEN